MLRPLRSLKVWSSSLFEEVGSRPRATILHAAGVVSLSDRRAHVKLSHLFKLVNRLVDYPDAPLHHKVHHYNARQLNTKQLVIPQARTLQFKRSFFPDTVKRWNSLPPDSISCTSLPMFKKSLCGHN